MDNSKLEELIWANVFHDAIKGSEWFLDTTPLNPGRWAIGYNGLYVLYRVLNEFRPINILELGLGESTKMIGDYANHYGINHIVVEHDDNWVKNWKKKE